MAWSAVNDSGCADLNNPYSSQASVNSGFSSTISGWDTSGTNNTSQTVSDGSLTSGTTVYARVRATDTKSNASDWTTASVVCSPAPTSIPSPTPIPVTIGAGTSEWTMVAHDPSRSSASPVEVAGNLHVEWYTPIKAYIPPQSQIIAANSRLYISTARGLIALNANNGNLSWRFDTELPLGNSPTYSNGVLYVGGFDRKLYALNATTGAVLWSYSGAQGGF